MYLQNFLFIFGILFNLLIHFLACLISFLHFDWPYSSDFVFLIISNTICFFFDSCNSLIIAQNKTLVLLSRGSLALLCLSSENILSVVWGFFILSHIWMFDPGSSTNTESKFWLLKNHFLSPKYLLLSVLWNFWVRASRYIRSSLDVKTLYWISSHYFSFHHFKHSFSFLWRKQFLGC